ncbi:MAG: DUF481 domain-containing protein [Oleiphilaceae bacterium]|nr:DUF481 domain-containing protein [Oleiphilaceae bacterium]
MLLTRKGPLLAAVIVATSSASAVAQEGWSGSAEAGLVSSSGNTSETSITARVDVTRDWADWRQKLNLESRYAEQEEVRTAERYRASTQLDYKFNPHDFVFVRASYDNDDFSGFEFQATASAGYGRRAWDAGEKSYLDISAGVGYRFSRFDQPDPDGKTRREDPIGRFAANFSYALSPAATFQQDLETEVGLNNGESISKSVTSLQANLRDSLAMRFSYTVERESEVPAGSKNTDTITAVTLLYSF